MAVVRCFLAGFALALVWLSSSAVRGAEEQAIAFYDPDANHQAILQITSWFNRYLHEGGTGLIFQPVHRREDFERLVKTGKAAYAMVSSNYLRETTEIDLQPLLVPASKGDVYYRKLLLQRGAPGSDENLAGKSIAASFSGENESVASKQVLEMLQRAGLPVEGALVTLVPKDIDALLALAFGQVQAALVTPNSVDVLKQRYPAAVAALRTVHESKPILRSPLCVVQQRASAQRTEQVLASIRSMTANDNGRNAMLAMGFDDWVEFRTEMLAR